MQKRTIRKKAPARISVGAVGKFAPAVDTTTLLNANATDAAMLTKQNPLIIKIAGGSTRERLVRQGKYSGHNALVARPAPRAPQKEDQEFECRIFHFDQIINSDDAARKMSNIDTRHPWKPATIEHLLVLGARMPHLQGQFPITALGTIFRNKGLSLVACLHHGDGPKRYVILRWWGDDWCGDFAFLGVRKIIR